MENIYGYVRVSSKDQNEDRQILAMQGLGIPAQNIYTDKQSGKNFKRPQYQILVEKMEPGDLLYILSIDRLGRNYEEIQYQWRLLTKEKGIDIAVIDMPLLDTRKGKDLMGTFIADLTLQILSFVAQNERESIKKRQQEGIVAARLRGVRFGRPPKPLLEPFLNAYNRWKAGEISKATAARECKMPFSTFRYQVEIYEKTKDVQES